MEYRLYFIRDGHFTSVEALECEDDEKAIETARRLDDGRAMELWQLGRLVKRFPLRPSKARR